MVLASYAVQWILLGKLISGCPDSSIFTLTYTLLQLRDVGLRKVVIDELWCGVSLRGAHKTECIIHYISQSLCSHVGFDLHNKPQWGKYFYQLPLIDMETDLDRLRNLLEVTPATSLLGALLKHCWDLRNLFLVSVELWVICWSVTALSKRSIRWTAYVI